MEYIEIGQIVNTNGLKGVVKVNPFTDDISKFEDLKYVYIQLKNELKKVKIEQVRYNKNQVLLKLEGIDSIEEAEKYRNFYLKTEKESQEDLGEDTYYIVDLIGLDVYSDKNEREAIKKNNVVVAHCADSNINLCSGICPVREMLNEGVWVTLGSDIAAGASMAMYNMITLSIKASKVRCFQSEGKRSILFRNNFRS